LRTIKYYKRKKKRINEEKRSFLLSFYAFIGKKSFFLNIYIKFCGRLVEALISSK
tara:strand:+ start:8173 stop:8337 length:165 start_codon:yes stop_codon:yes gene_type:complete